MINTLPGGDEGWLRETSRDSETRDGDQLNKAVRAPELFIPPDNPVQSIDV